MSFTLDLIRVIGSPFCSTENMQVPRDKTEALDLYEHAVKNKIGLLYLESLKKCNRLEEFGLELEYYKENKKCFEQMITAKRVSDLFNRYNIDYAIFKSIFPFPANPNDIDIIHFGSNEDFEQASKTLLRSNYIEIKGLADSEQRMFHDSRTCGHLTQHTKDIYDIDLYQKISASCIVYLDKKKLKTYVVNCNMSEFKTKVLKPEAELIAMIIHSIIPEMLCTLLIYYVTLYYLSTKNTDDFDDFLDIADDNCVLFAVSTHFALVAELHRAAHGFVPEILDDIIVKVDANVYEKDKLVQNSYKMPHLYTWYSFSMILKEKSKEYEFRRSFIKQIVFMLNFNRLKWVVSNIFWRRRRDTY